MGRTLLIHKDKQNDQVKIATLDENNYLIGYVEEDLNKEVQVGDIFLGRVKLVTGALNAAFIDMGLERDGFLHYTDLTPNIRSIIKFTKGLLEGRDYDPLLRDFTPEPPTEKGGKIENILEVNMYLPVQVKKEPISNKGPRVSCEISIPGRYFVIHPFQDIKGISRKIEDKEQRKRLKKIIEKYYHPLMGLIVRTAAANATEEQLLEDLENLKKKWIETVNNIRKFKKLYRTGKMMPVIIYKEPNRIKQLLRDLLAEPFDKIVVDDPALFEELRESLLDEMPELVDKLYLHQLEAPLFQFYQVDDQIHLARNRQVPLSEGAYLIIDRTEAFHIIDVNSGSYVPKEGSQEETALKINLIAAKEIARQIKLRDMGGLILIDFIDMTKSENKKRVFETFKKELEKIDRARKAFDESGLSKFSILEMTRERSHSAISAEALKCPYCAGTGYSMGDPTLMVAMLLRDLERKIKQARQDRRTRALIPRFTLVVGPHLEEELKKKLPDFLKKHKFLSFDTVKIDVEINPDYALFQYNIIKEQPVLKKPRLPRWLRLLFGKPRRRGTRSRTQRKPTGRRKTSKKKK